MSVIHHFADWRGLRKALGFTQHEMARLLAMCDASYKRMETHGVRPAREQTINHLRYALADPEIRQMLKQAEYPHPFPDDVHVQKVN